MTYEPRTYGGCPCGEHPARAADAEGTAERVMLTGSCSCPITTPRLGLSARSARSLGYSSGCRPWPSFSDRVLAVSTMNASALTSL
jgi:hypothetical protein